MHEYDPAILDILKEGNFTKVRQLFVITDDNLDVIYDKFELWCFVFTPAVFKKEEAEFHREIKQNLCDLYLGKIMSLTEIAFRGASKTTYAKLFVAFVLANDQRTSRRKYFKIVSEDPINSTQFSTDVYNILVGKKIKYYYPHLFQKTDLKREETKSSFTLSDGRKVLASTVDKGQRGHLQGEEASRPDFVIFEDFETSDTIQSLVISEDIWRTMEEAWNGRSIDGVALYNCNYISKRRNVQRILERARRSPEAHRVHKVPILINGASAWPTAFTVEQIRQIERDSTDFQGEYMCLKPDTLVLSSIGLKEIREIKVGDYVLTHKNRLRKVLKVFENYSEDLIDLTIDGKIFTITKNHPVLVLRNKKEIWVEAGKLTASDLLLKSSMVNFTHD